MAKYKNSLPCIYYLLNLLPPLYTHHLNMNNKYAVNYKQSEGTKAVEFALNFQKYGVNLRILKTKTMQMQTAVIFKT